MRKTVVIDIVGLTPGLIGPHTPRIQRFVEAGALARIEPMLPAVTCSVQSTYLTGKTPRDHGIVGNGWYSRDTCEVHFWQQANALVQGPKLWDTARARDASFTCANYFWWYNMYSSVDFSVTPRPMYPADGRKLPDVYTQPAELRDELQQALGTFPLFKFWGPATSIASSRWIADAAIQTDKQYDPTLSLIYLPHLDYNLQRLGPGDPALHADLREVDEICGSLIDHYEGRGASVMLLSEYGIMPVSRPLHINRLLRQHGFIAVREELGCEVLDAGASTAFAVADHQVAHVVVNDRVRLAEVKALLEACDGVAQVLDAEALPAHGLDHERSGELVVLADPDAWFTYYYWEDDARAPDFARTVDIHRKPGYDPVELFLETPEIASRAKVVLRLVQKKLGFRGLMDVIPLDAARVKGSHGVHSGNPDHDPVVIASAGRLQEDRISATSIHDLILEHVFEEA